MVIENNKIITLLCSFLVLASSCEKEPPIIIECSDLSNNWDVKSTIYPTEFDQNDIFFVNEEMGFTVGYAGSIIKTSNGGNSWEVINDRNFSNKITELKLTKVFFVNNNLGFIGGERKDFGDEDELLLGAILIKTLDGGHTWTKKYFSNVKRFDDIIFFDSSNGIALATVDKDSVNLIRKSLITTDGGNNWQDINTPGISINSYDLEYANSTLFVLAKDEVDNAIIAISNNKGLNWSSKFLPEPECNRIIFLNDQIGYLTCGNLFVPERVYKTYDQGNTWNIIENSPINNFSVVHFVSDQQGIVINNIYQLIQSGGEWMEVLVSVEVFESFNGGETWSKKIIDGSCGFDGPSFGLNDSLFYIIGDIFNKFELK